MWKARKPSKRDIKRQIKTLKKFIAGENVINDIVEQSFDLSKLSVAQLNELVKIKSIPDSEMSHSEKIERVRALIDEATTFSPVWVNKIDGKPLFGDSPSWLDQRILVNGKPVTEQEYEQIIAEQQARGGLVWHETRSYKNEPLV